MDLNELRTKIDVLDSELIRLLNERAELVHGVGQVKRASGLEIYAPERENQLLTALAAKNTAQEAVCRGRIARHLPEIMSASLRWKKTSLSPTPAPEATWTHQAARNKFGASVKYLPRASIGDVFEAVSRGRADYGVVPIENSTRARSTTRWT